MTIIDIHTLLQHSSVPFSFDTNLPLVLIDFDGVVNPESQMPWEEVFDDMMDGVFMDSNGFPHPVRFSPTVVGFFKSLEGRANVVWLSTWLHDTESFPAAMGFPVRPWLASMPTTGRWWKLDVVEYLTQWVPKLLWADDDIVKMDGCVEFLDKYKMVKVVSPLLHVGLTPDDLKTIAEFVDSY